MCIKSTVLTLSFALGRVPALAACRLLQVIGFGAAAAAQSVRLIAPLSKRRRTLRLERPTELIGQGHRFVLDTAHHTGSQVQLDVFLKTH